MARRKKEPEGFHRRQIAEAAAELFRVQGTERTTMDDIAGKAGYSKATLYVYFQNKRDIVGELALQSMELLREHLETALAVPGGTRCRYDALCRELAEYQRQYPEYFRMALGEMAFDPGAGCSGAARPGKECSCVECPSAVRSDAEYPGMACPGEVRPAGEAAPGGLPVERRLFETGERILQAVGKLLRDGMARGDLRPGLEVPQTVFAFWAALSGIIQMAAEKQAYLESVLRLSPGQFLEDSFALLYRSIERRE